MPGYTYKGTTPQPEEPTPPHPPPTRGRLQTPARALRNRRRLPTPQTPQRTSLHPLPQRPRSQTRQRPRHQPHRQETPPQSPLRHLLRRRPTPQERRTRRLRVQARRIPVQGRPQSQEGRTVARRMTRPTHCLGCGKPLRSSHEPPTPETVRYGAKGNCTTCNKAAQKPTKDHTERARTEYAGILAHRRRRGIPQQGLAI